ncbi:YoaK family protein [Treponema sp. HNW]|uniref:YoaK family protein n=1 Tax=Treponema sp. HNW TaxID=3116654 RepID=UPI003D101195
MKMKNTLISVWIAVLTFLSGLLNGAAFSLYASAFSHHTGNLTKAAAAISHFDFLSAAKILLLPLSFFAGSFISGVLFYDKDFKLAKRYGVLLMSFSVVFACLGFIEAPILIHSVFICLILGIQNGMFIFYKGVLIRTAHFTGYLTEAGFCLGAYFRTKADKTKHASELKRSLFYLVSILCFMFGAFCSIRIGRSFFFAAAFIYFICGLCYFTLRKLRHKIRA